MSRKRVMYSWLKRNRARTCKAYIAVVCDNVDWSEVFSGNRVKKKIFRKEVVTKVVAAFPAMFGIVRDYYEINGRDLTIKDFENLLYGRFMNMLDFDKNKKKIFKTGEHPLKSDDEKLKKAYRIAKKMYKRNRSYNNRNGA